MLFTLHCQFPNSYVRQFKIFLYNILIENYLLQVAWQVYYQNCIKDYAEIYYIYIYFMLWFVFTNILTH